MCVFNTYYALWSLPIALPILYHESLQGSEGPALFHHLAGEKVGLAELKHYNVPTLLG